MSYAQGLSRGANIFLAADAHGRSRLNSVPGVGGAVPRTRSLPTGPSPQAAEGAIDPVFEYNRKLNAEAQQAYDAKGAQQQQAFADQQARDYERGAQMAAIGSFEGAREYLNNYGNPDANIDSIVQNKDGSITVRTTPISGGGSATLGDKTATTAAEKDGKNSVMNFASPRDFFTKFYGLVQPKGAQVATAEKDTPVAQDWSEIANGTRILDKNSGRMRETGYAEPLERGGGSRGGRGGSGSKKDSDASDPIFEQVDNYILNRVASRVGGDISQFQTEGGDGMEKKIDWNRVKQAMTPEELQAYNLALTTGDQVYADDPTKPAHVIASKLYTSLKEKLDGQPKYNTDRSLGAAQGGNASPSSQIPANDEGIQQLSTYLGSLKTEGEREKALIDLADSNPDLVVAYRNALKDADAYPKPPINTDLRGIVFTSLQNSEPTPMRKAMDSFMSDTIPDVFWNDPANYWVKEPYRKFQAWKKEYYAKRMPKSREERETAFKEFEQQNPKDAADLKKAFVG